MKPSNLTGIHSKLSLSAASACRMVGEGETLKRNYATLHTGHKTAKPESM